MPRGAGRGLKPKLYGFLGGVTAGGLLWHIMTEYTDPPFIMVEVAIAVAVLALLLLPRSPQTPNLNLIPIIH